MFLVIAFKVIIFLTCLGLDNVDLYICIKCNRTFKQKSRYERHITNHPSEKHYLCETCNKTFTRMSHLEKHTRTHTEERSHVCKVCGAAFILPHHLVRHNLIHSGHRPFQCEICNKQFTRKAGLTQHQHVHTGLRQYSCDVPDCGKEFTDRTTLRRHLLTHSREKPFVCKECDKTFRTKSACRKHYLRHFKDGSSYKCGVCEEMFKNEEDLRIHSEIHEEKQRSSGAFRCGFCLRVFKSQKDLDTHVPLHESGLVHTCQHCAVKFYTQEDLLQHMHKHFSPTSVTSESPSVPLNAMIDDVKHSTEQSSIEQQSIMHQAAHTDMNKVMVVLQLPQTLPNLKNEHGTLHVENIQQLLGTVRVDKLVVTTDPVSNNSSQTLALQLSQDQQQSIQHILQTTNIIQGDGTSPLNDVTSSISQPPFVDLATHDSIDPEELSSPVRSSFVLKSMSHQPPEDHSKNVSQYLIVPPTGAGFQPLVNNKENAFNHTSLGAVNVDDDENASKIKIKVDTPSSIESSSVFKPSQNILPTTFPHSLQLLVPNDNNDVTTFTTDNNENSQEQQRTFSQSATTLTIDNLHENNRQIKSEPSSVAATTSTYFQHAEYESSLDGDLLTHEGTTEFTIVSN